MMCLLEFKISLYYYDNLLYSYMHDMCFSVIGMYVWTLNTLAEGENPTFKHTHL